MCIFTKTKFIKKRQNSHFISHHISRKVKENGEAVVKTPESKQGRKGKTIEKNFRWMGLSLPLTKIPGCRVTYCRGKYVWWLVPVNFGTLTEDVVEYVDGWLSVGDIQSGDWPWGNGETAGDNGRLPPCSAERRQTGQSFFVQVHRFTLVSVNMQVTS